MIIEEVDRNSRNEHGELDVVRLSWDFSGILLSEKGSSNFLPDIEYQLKDHDWTQLPVEVSVGKNPDRTWTIFLPPSISLNTWISSKQASWVDFLIYMESTYLDGEEENYRANLAWLQEAYFHGA